MLKHEWRELNAFLQPGHTHTHIHRERDHTEAAEARRTFRQTVKNMTPYFRFPYADNNGRQYGAAYAQK